MRLLLFAIPLFSACITDDGEIEEACDEVAEPCIWEDGDSAEDTGAGSEAGD